MFLDLSNFWIITLNVLGIPTAHIFLSVVSTRLPDTFFERRSGLTPSSFELALHQKLFLTRKWKACLPDAAPWMGGFPKAKLLGSTPEYLRKFVLETRRGEFSHWAQLIVISAFTGWNPWPANLIIVGYAILSNLPCILNLRYTRLRLLRVLNHTST